jgi:hypothetical protein
MHGLQKESVIKKSGALIHVYVLAASTMDEAMKEECFN